MSSAELRHSGQSKRRKHGVDVSTYRGGQISREMGTRTSGQNVLACIAKDFNECFTDHTQKYPEASQRHEGCWRH